MEVQRMYLCKLLSLFYWIPLISSQNSGSNVSVQPKPNVIIDDILTNCVLRPVDLSITSKVDKMIQNGAKLIHIDFIVLNFTGTLHEESKGKVYKPLSWVLTTNRQGRSILLLRPQYEILSLNTLSLGTERTTVIITQSPSNCLTNNNSTVVSNYLREFLLYKFKTPIRGSNDTVADATFKEQEQACNLNIASKEQKASFYYSCCRKTSNGQTICEELTWDNYVILLFVCIYVFDFFAVMFIPMLIPSSLYRDKYETTCYEYELETPLTLVMQKTPEHITKDNVFPISYFDQMNEFKKTIQKMQYDVTYEMTLKKLHILTETSKLIPPNSVPVGLFESLYSALFKCEIRKKASITDCCNSNLLGPCTPLGFKLPWFKCLQFFMLVLLYIAMTAFWIVRVVVFYTYENSDRMEKEKAATDRNLELWYTLDLTWTLTPVHILFLICYGVFAADVIIFGILTRHVATTLNHVMRRCLRDMREISRTRAFGWSIQILIHPFKHCGIFGVLFALFYYIPAVPIVTLTLAFYCLPTINILVRLLIYFVAYLFPYGRNCLTNRCCMKLKQLWRYIRRVFRMDILTNQAEVLLRAGISRDARTKVDRTPLHVAAQEGHSDIVELLIQHAADIDAKDMLKMTPLHWASEKGHKPVLETLIKHGADINCENKFDRTPLDIAIANGRADIAELLTLAQMQYGGTVQQLEEVKSHEVMVNGSMHADLTSITEGDSITIETTEIDQSENIETVTVTTDEQTHKDILPVNIFQNISKSSELSEQQNSSVLATLAALAEATAPNTTQHNAATTEAMNWLESQGITMITTSEGGIITSAIESGQSITLTEAGKIALNFIKQQGEEELVVKPEVDLGEEVTETEHLGGEVGEIVSELPEGTELVTEDDDSNQNVLTIVSSQSLSEADDAVAIGDQSSIVTMDGEDLAEDNGIVMVTEVTGEIVTPTDGILTVTEVSDHVTNVTMEADDMEESVLHISDVVTTTEDGGGDACEEPPAKRLRSDTEPHDKGDGANQDDKSFETMDKDTLKKQLEEMQKQAEAFKQQLKEKEVEAETYKKRLSDIGIHDQSNDSDSANQ